MNFSQRSYQSIKRTIFLGNRLAHRNLSLQMVIWLIFKGIKQLLVIYPYSKFPTLIIWFWNNISRKRSFLRIFPVTSLTKIFWTKVDITWTCWQRAEIFVGSILFNELSGFTSVQTRLLIWIGLHSQATWCWKDRRGVSTAQILPSISIWENFAVLRL